MMKKIVFIAVAFLFACVAKESTVPKGAEVYIGTIVVIGSEPFTNYGLDLGDGKVLRLKFSPNKEVIQGKRVKIISYEKNSVDEQIVYSFEYLEK